MNNTPQVLILSSVYVPEQMAIYCFQKSVPHQLPTAL